MGTYDYKFNIKIGGLTLLINPTQYTKESQKMGSFERTVRGNLVSMDVSSRKYIFHISGLTQSQIEEIKLRAALDFNVELIDYIPIVERGVQSRTVLETLETRTIEGETLYRYVPTYTVSIIEFKDSYKGNSVEYTIIAEEQ